MNLNILELRLKMKSKSVIFLFILFFVCIISIREGSAVGTYPAIDSNMVLYLHFNDTTIYDYSNMNNTIAKVGNPTFNATGDFLGDGSYYNNYTSDYFTSTDKGLNITGNITIAGWVNPSVCALGTNSSTIISKADGVGGYTVSIDNACKLQSSFYGLTDSVLSGSSAVLPINTWSFFAVNISHTQNLSLQINVTDIDGDAINYTINDSRFTINATGNINKTNNISTVGIYNITVNITDGTAIASMWIYVNVTNIAPIVSSATISPVSPADADNLTCNNGTLSDSDNDIITLSYQWYKNDTAQNITTKILGAGNTTSGDIWKCGIIPNDGAYNGSTTTSASVSIGTGLVSPIITITNSTTTITGIVSSITNPTNNDSWINITTNFTDPNAETWTIFECTTDSATSAGCTVGTYCMATTATKTANCRYNITNLNSQTYTFYTFVLDSSGLISASSSNTFNVNHYPTTPTIVTPTTATAINYSIISFTATDSDSDIINYTIYGGINTSNMSIIYVGNTSYNWTNLTDGIHYLIAYSTDMHGYTSLINSSIYNFTVDTTPPNITIIGASDVSIYTSEAETLSVTLIDALVGINPSACKLEIQKSNQNFGTGLGLAYNITTDTQFGDTVSYTFTPGTFTAGTLNLNHVYCNDILGNSITSTASITVTVTEASGTGVPGGTGGGGGAPSEDTALKYGVTNLMQMLQKARLVYDKNNYVVSIIGIDSTTKSVQMNIGVKQYTFVEDITTPVDLNTDGTADITIKMTSMTTNTVNFLLNYYSSTSGKCNANIYTDNTGKVTECEFACTIDGCTALDIGQKATYARECSSRLLEGGVCVATSSIKYILSEDYFQLQGVLNAVNQVTTVGVKGIPAEKDLTVTNTDSEDIFIKFVGTNLQDIAEEKLIAGQSKLFSLNIYPVRGETKGFIDLNLRKSGNHTVTHSILYEMNIVTCKDSGMPATYAKECCSKTINDEKVCISSISSAGNIYLYLSIIVLVGALVIATIYSIKKRRKN
jgi:hypothetical protein